MNSLPSVNDGLREFLSDQDRFRMKMTACQTVEVDAHTYYMAVPDGTVQSGWIDVVKITIRGTTVRIFRMAGQTPIGSCLQALIKEYTGEYYQGGGIYFDLLQPDSLDWLEKFIKAIAETYLDWRRNYGQ